MERVRDLAITIMALSITLLVALIIIWLYNQSARLDGIITNFSYISTKGREASDASIEVLREQQVFIGEQERRFNDPKTQQAIGLALRIGRPATEAIFALRHAGSDLDGLIQDARRDTLPAIRGLAEESQRTTATLGLSLARVGDSASNTFSAATETTKNVDSLIMSAEVRRIIENSVKITDEGAKDAPDFFAASTRLTNNLADASGEVAIGLHKLNKPTTLKDKIKAAGLTFIFREVPFIVAAAR